MSDQTEHIEHIGDMDIKSCEFLTEPFKPFELDEIATYRAAVAGVWDCFDSFDADDIRDHGDRLVQEMKNYLIQWGDRIAALRTGLLIGDGIHLTEAGSRFVRMELDRWRDSRAVLTGAVLDFMGIGVLVDPVAGVDDAPILPPNVTPLNR